MKDDTRRHSLIPLASSLQPLDFCNDCLDSSIFVPQVDTKNRLKSRPKKYRIFSEDNFACGIFFIQGLSLVFVWNALVNSTEFFNSRLGSNSYSLIITEILFSIFTITRCAFFFLSSVVVDKISPYLQVFISNFVCCVVFIIFSFISISENLSEKAFILTSMILVFFASVFSVFLYTGNYAILSTLPRSYSQCISLGQGTAGMLTCIAKLVTLKLSQSKYVEGPGKLAHNIPSNSDSFLYFFLTACLLLFASLSFFYFTNYFSSVPNKKTFQILDNKKSASSVSLENTELLGNSSQSNCSNHIELNTSSTMVEFYSTITKPKSKIRVLWWCNFIVCFQTMFLFPCWPQMTKSVHEPFSDPLHGQVFTVFILFLFNLGDWIGRILLSFPTFYICSDKALFSLALLRFLHVPLYILGNIDMGGHHSYPLPTILSSDFSLITGTLFFGISSGYLTTLFLIEAPNRVADHHLKIRVSFYMLLGLVLSVALGSIASLVLKILLLSHSSKLVA